MFLRTWTTDFDVSRLPNLTSFATDVSLPFLETRPGCRGVQFLLNGNRWTTLTYWEDRSGIEAMNSDPGYGRIVADVLALGVLGTEQKTEVLRVVGSSRYICIEGN